MAEQPAPCDVSVVCWNVLFGLCWDPDLPRNRIHLQNIHEVYPDRNEREKILARELGEAWREILAERPEQLYGYRHFIEKYRRSDFLRLWPSGDVVEQDGKVAEKSRYSNADIIPVAVVEKDPKMREMVALFDTNLRLERVKARIAKEMEQGRPLFMLTEVTQTWRKELQPFFERLGYEYHTAQREHLTQLPGIWEARPQLCHDGMGVVVAFPAEKYHCEGKEVVQVHGTASSCASASTGDAEAEAGGIRPESPDRVSQRLAELELSETAASSDCAPGSQQLEQDQRLASLSPQELREVAEVVYAGRHQPPLLGLILQDKACGGRFVAVCWHMPQNVHEKTSSGHPIGDAVMGIRAAAAMVAAQGLVRCQEKKRLPLLLCGDWNTKPEDPNYTLFTDRSQIVPSGCLARLLSAFFSVAEGSRNQPFQVNSDLTLRLRNAYHVAQGELPELTTRTQEFHGAIDHMFVSEGVDVRDARAMPRLRELEEKCLFFPDLESGEPSDHLMQRMEVTVPGA